MPLNPLSAQIGVSATQGALQTGFNALNNFTNLGYYQMQRRHQQEDWRRDALYNSPTQQVERLKAAGISPHSAFGNPSTNMAPQSSRPQMAAAPSAYQVNGANNAMQMQIGMAQLKQMELQNAKTIAETNKVNADTKTVEQNYTLDSNTALPKRMGEIEIQLQQIQNLQADRAIKIEQANKLKEEVKNVVAQTGLLNIETKFLSPYLQGRNELQTQMFKQSTSQVAKTFADIERINIQNEQDVKIFQYKVRQLTEQIQGGKLQNEGQLYQNMYAPSYLQERNESMRIDKNTKMNNLKYLETIPPEARFMLERLGGEDMVKILTRRGALSKFR